MITIGPKSIKEKLPFFLDNHFIEITGNFSDYPEGIILYNSDWYKIIAKYPHIYELIYNYMQNDYELNYRYERMTREESDKRVDNEILSWINKNQDGENQLVFTDKIGAQYLPQEIIDSIEFVIPKEYVSLNDIRNGNLKSFSDIKVDTKEEGINPGTNDLLDYYNSNAKADLQIGISLDMSYMTESALRGKNDIQKVIMLADFLLNYQGCQADSHLYWFNLDKDIINGRICNIPLIEFAKLNSLELAEIFSNFGVEEVTTAQSENSELVRQVALLIGLKTQIREKKLKEEERQIELKRVLNHIDQIMNRHK